MLRQLMLTGLVGLALVEITGRVANTAFAAAGSESSRSLRLRGASGLSAGGEDVTMLLLRATRNVEKEQRHSAFSGLCSFAAAGMALAGVAFCTRKRSLFVDMGWRIRFKHIYGDGTDSDAPKVPQWLENRSDGCPEWLTVEKWQALPRNLKTRSQGFFKMMFKPDGTPRRTKRTRYTIPEAVDEIYDMFEAGMSARSPPWSIEVMMHMNLDAKYPDQQIRMGLNLPHGVGKEKRVAVFCKPDEEQEVLELGAAIAGQTLITAIEKEQFDFDVLIAKPMSMPALAKLGKILGPRRLMPSPKSGTVVQDYKAGIDNFKSGGAIEVRNNEHMLVACSVGSMALGKEKIVDNIRGLLKEMADKAPEGAKNKEIMWRRIKLCGTRSPSVQLYYTEFPDHRSEELKAKSEMEKKKRLLTGAIER
eukprot:TRINITY_DN42268_c0_g1_i1.p1 TRINITY_DN42268_c0_g1~~TRINITY_DN42268_c0_g1_i1.p1  ORF type:complete len:441 (-),score=91.47 TRINITY_DN42268_c0_g1_i1:64-1320(-)